MPTPTPVNYGTPVRVTWEQAQARRRKKEEDARAAYELELAREARANGFDDIDDYITWLNDNGRFH